MKKATLKDIANLAQVSVATVSYVLNNVSTQTIPEETRCRVLEASKELQYIPNLAARSLVMQKTGLIGILVNRANNEGYWKKFRYAALIEYLERNLTERGYHVVLSSIDASAPRLDIISERKLDGVFLIDVRSDTFHHISRLFSVGVPLIVIDSLIDDSLFYKVVDDYEQLLTKHITTPTSSNHYLIVDDFNNIELVSSIKKVSALAIEDIHVMSNEQELRLFLNRQKGRSGIIINEYISVLAAKYTDPSTLTVICNAGCPDIVPTQAKLFTYGEQKYEVTLELMLKLMNNPLSGSSNKYIKIQAE
ncbi:MAG TPA: LacI family transcriptional regulator [Candidatus Paenibacillus intestinavium]|nr:LacI family transcriptional regulator [Candidatus Paenibacillus intestinavium]